jgi:DUF4097 and DUF4098 domain-containing protein YvlB
MSSRHTLMFLALALVAGPAIAQQNISKVNGGIDAESGQTYGELETVNGSIRIAGGAVTGDAETVNGGIKVGDRARTGTLGTVNGGVRLGREVSVDGGIETVNGEIFVDRGGKVRNGVETVNGSIGLVGTQLGGGIETVRGDITVGAGSVVKGGLKVSKSKGMFNTGNNRVPRIVIGPNAVVEGPLVFEREVTLHVHRSARTGAITGATAKAYDGDRAPQD